MVEATYLRGLQAYHEGAAGPPQGRLINSLGECNLRESIDLASDRLRGYVLAANDESVGSRESLVKGEPPASEDGWVTRRRRDGGFDWAIVRLGAPGVIEEVVVDTTGFTGNYPSEASVEGCVAPHNALPEELSDWTEVVCRSTLNGNVENSFKVSAPPAVHSPQTEHFPRRRGSSSPSLWSSGAKLDGPRLPSRHRA